MVKSIRLDKTGNVIETTYFHEYPTPFSTYRYKYDRNGLCIESIQSWSKSAKILKTVYEYDANHTLIKETIHNNLKLLYIYTYVYSNYDKMQNWLTQHTYVNGKLDGVTERAIVYR